jgi:hypothetical protein
MAGLQLEIRGYDLQPVPHELIAHDAESPRLAILLPGFGYTCDMPLFYYLESLVGNAGYDVLRVDARFGKTPGMHDLSFDERIARIGDDVAAVLRAGIEHREYQEVVIVAKSITTVAIANLLSAGPMPSQSLRIVWLTPLIAILEQCERIAAIAAPGLIVTGDKDPVYDAASLNRLLTHEHLRACVIADGDHSLGIEGDISASIAALNRVVTTIAAFLSITLPTRAQ